MNAVSIEKTGATTIVRHFNDETNETTNFRSYNKNTNLSVVPSTQNISVVDPFDVNDILIIPFEQIVDKLGATTAEEYLEAAAAEFLFSEHVV